MSQSISYLGKGLLAISSSYLMLAGSSAHASMESDAASVFAAALLGSFTFNSVRTAEDISLSFMHFTKSGRQSLISELQRSKVVVESVSKKGGVKSFANPAKFSVVRRAGAAGVDEYDIRGDFEIQTSLCEGASCVPSGPRKRIAVTGVVVPVTAFSRPSLKVSVIALGELVK